MGKTFRRNFDFQTQYKGVDCYLGKGIIDEKSKNTTKPNLINDYWASVELYHKPNSPFLDWSKGWFIADEQQTTHYFYLYRFEDNNGNINRVIGILFKKAELKDYIEYNSTVPFEQIVDDAMNKRFGTRYYDMINNYSFKLTGSNEGSAVLTTKISDLMNLNHTIAFDIRPDSLKRINMEQIE